MSVAEMGNMAKALGPLYKKMGTPQPGDWLDVHEEPGQGFKEYRESGPVLPDAAHRTIYVQPIGDFTAGQKKLLDLTADFMERWFGLPVKTKDAIPLSVIPKEARRVHPVWGDEQILTGYILDELLLPKIPGDAIGQLALTVSDLWPGEGWNFVFGQASLSDRVGVWSIYRKGNADGTKEEFEMVLRRTLQTAVHEMGHMLGMLHCTQWECAMNGSNSLEESDRRPLALCPDCLEKIWWATKADPVERFEKLEEFYKSQGLDEEAEFTRRSLEIVEIFRKSKGAVK